jgi:hypothetical protein
MSYEQAIEAAGAEILDLEEPESYRGPYPLLVRYKGSVGYVCFDVGTCPHCDEYLGEMSGREPTLGEMADWARCYLESLRTYNDMLLTRSNVEYEPDYEKFSDFLERTKHLVTV